MSRIYAPCFATLALVECIGAAYMWNLTFISWIRPLFRDLVLGDTIFLILLPIPSIFVLVLTDIDYLNPLLKSIANLDINKSLLRDSNIFTLADLSKTYSSLRNEFSSFGSFGKPSVQMRQILKECKDNSCGSIWYRRILIPVLGTTILEPGIGSDTWSYHYRDHT